MFYSDGIEVFTPSTECATCPGQLEIASRIEHLQIMQLLAQHAANGLVGRSGQEFDEAVREYFGNDEVAKAEAHDTRVEAAMTLEYFDDTIQHLKDKSDELTSACSGTLKMCGQKNDSEFTVELCTSTYAYQVNSEQPEVSKVTVWVRAPKAE